MTRSKCRNCAVCLVKGACRGTGRRGGRIYSMRNCGGLGLGGARTTLDRAQICKRRRVGDCLFRTDLYIYGASIDVGTLPQTSSGSSLFASARQSSGARLRPCGERWILREHGSHTRMVRARDASQEFIFQRRVPDPKRVSTPVGPALQLCKFFPPSGVAIHCVLICLVHSSCA